MLHVPGGQYVRGEVSTTDATGGVAASFFDANGGTVTIGSSQRLIVYDISMLGVTQSGRVIVTQGTDVAGSRLLGGMLSDAVPLQASYTRPIECRIGVTPKVFAGAAGQVDVQINGELVEV